jgi:hypothetical protein
MIVLTGQVRPGTVYVSGKVAEGQADIFAMHICLFSLGKVWRY